MLIAQALVSLLYILQLLILARVLLSWVDRNPYSSNPLKQALYSVTDPLLEPIQRYVPPIGGTLDISPIIAIFLLQVLQRLIFELA